MPPPPDPVRPSHHHLSPGMAVSASPSYFRISPLNPAATFESDHLIQIVPVLCFPSSRAQHKSHSRYHSQGSRILWALTSSPTSSAMQFILDLAHAMLFLIYSPLYGITSAWHLPSSSPTESLANSYSAIKTLPWYHLLRKAFHARHHPFPQAGVCIWHSVFTITHRHGHYD